MPTQWCGLKNQLRNATAGAWCLATQLWDRHQPGDEKRAIALYKQSADLGDVHGQFYYGMHGFDVLDWRRYYWIGQAAFRVAGRFPFEEAVTEWLDLLDNEGLSLYEGRGRIVFEIAPANKLSVDALSETLTMLCDSDSDSFYGAGDEEDAQTVEMLQRVVALYDAGLARARAALRCWSMVARRLRVVKDMRVLIAQTAWKQVWAWFEQESDRPVKRARVQD
jgi:hypothetical protein